MEKKRLLILDDEKEILKSLTRLLRKDYKVISFDNGSEALDYMKDNPVELIISDMRMPTMPGNEFLARSRENCPDATRFLLTGYSDMESTVAAINEGAIFSYISKPWDNNEIKLILSNATKMQDLEHEKNQLAESVARKNEQLESLNSGLEEEVQRRSKALAKSHEKLKKQYQSQSKHYKNLVDMLAEIIELRQPEKNGQLQRVANQCRQFAVKIGLSTTAAIHVYLTAILHEIGRVKNNEIMQEGQNIIDPETHYPGVGAAILEKLPAFKIEAKAIKHQLENFDGTGIPSHLTKELIPVEARILRIVKAYDQQVSGLASGAPASPELAKKGLIEQSEVIFDPLLVKQFIQFIEERTTDGASDIEYCISTNEVKVGDILKRDVVSPTNSSRLMTANQEITPESLSRLKQYEKDNQLVLALFV